MHNFGLARPEKQERQKYALQAVDFLHKASRLTDTALVCVCIHATRQNSTLSTTKLVHSLNYCDRQAKAGVHLV